MPHPAQSKGVTSTITWSDGTTMENNEYFPPGVKKTLDAGSECWIGQLENSMVLKYPDALGLLRPDEAKKWLSIESQLYQAVGEHPHILKCHGLREDGFLVLEHATNGDVFLYLYHHPDVPQLCRLRWCIETGKALVHCHDRRVLHCDIRSRNLLLDDKLSIKLADFQGRLVDETGKTILFGGSSEPDKYSCPEREPRDSDRYANVKTDIFAFGTTIFTLIAGHEPWPEVTGANDGDEEEVRRHFMAREFPTETYVCRHVVEKCWRQEYASAGEVLRDLEAVMAKLEPVSGEKEPEGFVKAVLARVWQVIHRGVLRS